MLKHIFSFYCQGQVHKSPNNKGDTGASLCIASLQRGVLERANGLPIHVDVEDWHYVRRSIPCEQTNQIAGDGTLLGPKWLRKFVVYDGRYCRYTVGYLCLFWLLRLLLSQPLLLSTT